jgi:hypothetical protein
MGVSLAMVRGMDKEIAMWAGSVTLAMGSTVVLMAVLAG